MLGQKIDTVLAGMSGIVEAQAPRQFTATQKTRIVAALSPFKGQRIGTVVNQGKRKNLDYLNELKSLLQSAGWQVFERGVYIAGPEPIGVRITVRESEWRSPAAQALVSALRQNGVDNLTFNSESESVTDGIMRPVKAGEIKLEVGDKN